MKKVILLLVGLIPFLIGYILNHFMMTTFYDVALPYGVIGFIWLVVWFFLGVLMCNFQNSEKQVTFFANLPAFAVLLLILFQEIIFGHYWANPIGLATQLYYLPVVNIASKITFIFQRLSMMYIVSFLLMCSVFYLGCCVRKHYTKRL